MGLSVWRTLLSSGDSDLIHRAAVAIRKLYFLFVILLETVPLDSCLVFSVAIRKLYFLFVILLETVPLDSCLVFSYHV